MPELLVPYLFENVGANLDSHMTSTITPILRAVRPVRLTAISKLPLAVPRRFNSTDAQKPVANVGSQSKDVAPLPQPQHVVEADIVSGAPC